MSTSDVDGVCGEFEGCKLDVEKKISDEELFNQPPLLHEDYPICFQRFPDLFSAEFTICSNDASISPDVGPGLVIRYRPINPLPTHALALRGTRTNTTRARMTDNNGDPVALKEAHTARIIIKW